MKLSALGAFILITGVFHSASALVTNELVAANNASVQDPQGHFGD